MHYIISFMVPVLAGKQRWSPHLQAQHLQPGHEPHLWFCCGQLKTAESLDAAFTQFVLQCDVQKVRSFQTGCLDTPLVADQMHSWSRETLGCPACPNISGEWHSGTVRQNLSQFLDTLFVPTAHYLCDMRVAWRFVPRLKKRQKIS